MDRADASWVWLSPWLLLISMPVLLLGAMPTRWLVGQMRRRSWHTRQDGYRLTDLLLELAQGIRIVKISPLVTGFALATHVG